VSTRPPDLARPPEPPPRRNIRKSIPVKPAGKARQTSITPVLDSKVIPAPRSESAAVRIARGVIGFAMVIGIGGTVAWGARRYVKTSQRFAVSEIITTGAKRRNPDELASIAGIAKG